MRIISDVHTVFKKRDWVLHMMLVFVLDIQLFEVVKVGWI
jgi:hypothetical protein